MDVANWMRRIGGCERLFALLNYLSVFFLVAGGFKHEVQCGIKIDKTPQQHDEIDTFCIIPMFL